MVNNVFIFLSVLFKRARKRNGERNKVKRLTGGSVRRFLNEGNSGRGEGSLGMSLKHNCEKSSVVIL